MNDSSRLEEVRILLESQYLGVLATNGPQGSHASLVAFASSLDLRTLVLATPMSTRKYAHMLSDPRVALLVDSRSNQRFDFHAAAAVTAYGHARIASKEHDQEWMHLYLQKHPHLGDFVRAPSCALMSIAVDRFSQVTSFQDVAEIFV